MELQALSPAPLLQTLLKLTQSIQDCAAERLALEEVVLGLGQQTLSGYRFSHSVTELKTSISPW